jgi:hypothetical protein
VERIQQDPRLTANRSKSVNSSIAEVGGERGYVGFVERNVLISQVPVRVARTLLSAFRRETNVRTRIMRLGNEEFSSGDGRLAYPALRWPGGDAWRSTNKPF